MLRVISTLCGLLLAHQVVADSNNETIPSHATTQSAPDGRGTSDIFFSALSIILLCTWNILHLNIPPRSPEPIGFFRKIWAKIEEAWVQVKWMILAMFVPEYILGKAFSDWASARITAGMNFYMEELGKSWQTIHGYYACMGGFVLDFSELEIPDTPPLEFEEICANLKGKSLMKPPSENCLDPVSLSIDEKAEKSQPSSVDSEKGGKHSIETSVKDVTSTDAISEKQSSSPATQNDTIGPELNAVPSKPLATCDPPTPPSTNTNPRTPKHYIAIVLQKVLDDDQVNIININRGRSRINISRLYHTMWALNQTQLASALNRGLLKDISAIPSANDLSGLDKGDTLVKLQAIYQSVWLAVQLLARKVGGLPSAQIEIAALAFAVPSIFTYWLYLQRPQGVENVTRLKAARMPTPGDVKILLDGGPYYLWTGQRGGDPTNSHSNNLEDHRARNDGSLDYASLPNDSLNWPNLWACTDLLPYDTSKRIVDFIDQFTMSNRQSVPVVLGSIIGGVLFGGIHCLAWDLAFPTRIEQLLWRISSVVLAAVPLVSAPFDLYWVRLNGSFTEVGWRKEGEGQWWWRVGTKGVLGGLLGVYVLARLYLMVEILRSLFYLPEAAFQDTWSGNFPSWG